MDPKEGPEARFGWIDEDTIVDLTSGPAGVRSLYDMAYGHGGVEEGLKAAAEALGAEGCRRLDAAVLLANTEDRSSAHLVSPVSAPVDAPHLLRVWLAGVTHEDSARLREMEAKQATGGSVNVYDQKYRECQKGGIPELFAKTDPEGPTGHGGDVSVPPNTIRMVPEIELVTVYAVDGDDQVVLLGYTGGNDYTDNGIEAQNPLNLPQAKNWSAGCASLGPVLVTPDAFDAEDIEVRCDVFRSGERVASKSGRTGEANLNMPEKAFHMERALFSRLPLNRGELQVLYWGTPAVFGESDLEGGLQVGDAVRMDFEGIGRLENRISAFPPREQLTRLRR